MYKNNPWQKRLFFAILSFALAAGTEALAADTKVTAFDSVTTALEYSPRLNILQTNQEAILYELDRAKGNFYPQVDVTFGYGAEAHSDIYTRARGIEHNFYDRLEANIRLSQLLYDGDEVGSQVAIEESKLVSAGHRVVDNAESIALDAILAHMEVYRQRELVSLADMNVNDHFKILEQLKQRQEAGAGSIADVDQTQSRLARTNASRSEVQEKLRVAEANYLRIVGKLAGDVEMVQIPADLMPKTLDDAIAQTMKNNPKVLALDANIEEADNRIDLSNSSFYPKIYADLISDYQDNVESSETYEHNNRAMLNVRWNIFDGYYDVNDRKAAIARKMQAIATRDDQNDRVVEEARVTWAALETARKQVVNFGDAVNYSQKTLDSYLKQFNVGQRTLLDVLDARNELFQNSVLLITAKVNEIAAAERLLTLSGLLLESLKIDDRAYFAEVVKNEQKDNK